MSRSENKSMLIRKLKGGQGSVPPARQSGASETGKRFLLEVAASLNPCRLLPVDLETESANCIIPYCLAKLSLCLPGFVFLFEDPLPVPFSFQPSFSSYHLIAYLLTITIVTTSIFTRIFLEYSFLRSTCDYINPLIVPTFMSIISLLTVTVLFMCICYLFSYFFFSR